VTAMRQVFSPGVTRDRVPKIRCSRYVADSAAVVVCGGVSSHVVPNIQEIQDELGDGAGSAWRIGFVFKDTPTGWTHGPQHVHRRVVKPRASEKCRAAKVYRRAIERRDGHNAAQRDQQVGQEYTREADDQMH